MLISGTTHIIGPPQFGIFQIEISLGPTGLVNVHRGLGLLEGSPVISITIFHILRHSLGENMGQLSFKHLGIGPDFVAICSI